MAERPSELDNINESESISTGEGAGRDTYLESRSDDYELSTAGTADVGTGIDGRADETGQIREQIEETRRELGETIDAIQERLSLENIKEQVSGQINDAVETAKDAVFEATIGKARDFMKNMGNEISRSQVFRTAQKNPLPLVLIGLGVGLLAYNGMSRGTSSRYGNGRTRYDLPSETGQTSQDSMLSSAGGKMTGAASSAYGSVTHAAQGALGSVSGVAGSAYNRVTDVAHQAYGKVGELGSKAHEQYDHYIEENPMAVGAVALALGAAVGFAIPESRYERQLMGEARENLMHIAQDRAGELVDRVKQVAGEAQRTLTDEAKAQGLTQ